MRPLARLVIAGVVIISVAACGDSSSSSGGKPAASSPSATSTSGVPAGASDVDPAVAAAVKARLVAFFEVVKAGGGAKAAAFLVYKGPDEARRYKAPAKYEGDEQRQVDRAVKKVKTHLDLGPPNFVAPEQKTKGAEKWVAWRVRYGEGADAKFAIYAFVDAGGTWLLGDIDEVREPSPPK